jgi:transcriptional regulator with XRE-family HTH domain
MAENHSLTGDDLKQWREDRDLNQDQLGDLLGISREWVGKMERGERTISDRIFLRFERVRKEPRFLQKRELPGTAGVLDESHTVYGSPETLRGEIRGIVEETISMAGEDVGKLGWIREQALRYVSTPDHWNVHEQVLRQLKAEQEAAAQAKVTHSPPKERNG